MLCIPLHTGASPNGRRTYKSEKWKWVHMKVAHAVIAISTMERKKCISFYCWNLCSLSLSLPHHACSQPTLGNATHLSWIPKQLTQHKSVNMLFFRSTVFKLNRSIRSHLNRIVLKQYGILSLTIESHCVCTHLCVCESACNSFSTENQRNSWNHQWSLATLGPHSMGILYMPLLLPLQLQRHFVSVLQLLTHHSIETSRSLAHMVCATSWCAHRGDEYKWAHNL